MAYREQVQQSGILTIGLQLIGPDSRISRIRSTAGLNQTIGQVYSWFEPDRRIGLQLVQAR